VTAPPSTVPGGKPVIEVPGLTPIFPVTTVWPALVTVEAPTTAKLFAEPSGGTDLRPYKVAHTYHVSNQQKSFHKEGPFGGLLFIFAVSVRSLCSEQHTLFFFINS
jgi:hypothetical protein